MEKVYITFSFYFKSNNVKNTVVPFEKDNTEHTIS